MTDINKAIAFAKECLQWEDAQHVGTDRDIEVFDGVSARGFFLTVDDVQRVLDTFLAKRYLIQINRGTSTLFKWTVIIGLQDKSVRGVHLGEARADSDDVFDAIFDACVMAARMDK
jgi:hypothetical protein